MSKTATTKMKVPSKKGAAAKTPAFPSKLVVLQEPEPVGDADLHAKLSVALADGPQSFGELRRRFDISPVRLQWDCIERFPEAYEKGADTKGRPTIGLRPDRPPLAEMLDREPLIKWIVGSGANGIYLASLHKRTGLTSSRIEELLASVTGIERLVRDGRILFKAIPNATLGGKVPKNTALIDPAILRDQLIGLCGTSQRHLSWLELHMERHEILAVLKDFGDDFGVDSESLPNADKLIWVRCPLLPKEGESLAESEETHNRAPVRPEAQVSLKEVFSEEELAELRHRPHAPGMVLRGMALSQTRNRQPVVEL